jgi:DNA-binding NtrC family response regulator
MRGGRLGPISLVMLRPSHRSPASVLVVEDEDLVRGLVVSALEDEGYDVVAAANGDDALAAAAARTAPVDLVLADVVMPGMSGPVVVEHLLARWPGTNVVFMSGYTGGPAATAAIGSRTLLQKPFGLESLLSTVACALGSQAV